MQFSSAAIVAVFMLLYGCGGPGGLEVNQSVGYYDIRGVTEEELAVQLKQKGTRWNDGQSYASTTAWNVSWDFEPDCAPWRCTVGSFRVTVSITTRLPRWVPEGDAPADLRLKWRDFTEKLLEHENGHRDRAIAGAADLLTAVQSLPSQSSREDLEREVNAITAQKMARMNAGQDEYDRTTAHGTSQGAVFP